MYCPKCASKTSGDEKFCRSCGLGLEQIARALGEQLPAKLDDDARARKRRLEIAGVGLLSIVGLGILSLILYGVVYNLIIVQGRTLEGLGILGFIGLIACGLISVILFAKADEVKGKAVETGAETPETAANTTGKLLPDNYFEPVPSVTERTTDPLTTEKNRNAGKP